MVVKDSFEITICICSCGGCCLKNYLCDECELATLRANGIPEEFLNEIHGLKCKYRGDYKFSELYYKLKEITRQLYNEYITNNIK